MLSVNEYNCGVWQGRTILVLLLQRESVKGCEHIVRYEQVGHSSCSRVLPLDLSLRAHDQDGHVGGEDALGTDC